MIFGHLPELVAYFGVCGARILAGVGVGENGAVDRRRDAFGSVRHRRRFVRRRRDAWRLRDTPASGRRLHETALQFPVTEFEKVGVHVIISVPREGDVLLKVSRLHGTLHFYYLKDLKEIGLFKDTA